MHCSIAWVGNELQIRNINKYIKKCSITFLLNHVAKKNKYYSIDIMGLLYGDLLKKIEHA